MNLPVAGWSTRSIFLVVGTLLSAIVLGYIFFFLDVSLAEAWQLCTEADSRWLLIFVALSLFTTFFRAWRYFILLAASGISPPTMPLFLVTLVRNAFADLLPARIGSLVYVFLATTRLGVPLTLASSSFALALILDIVAIVPLLLVCLALAGTAEQISRWSMLISALAILAIGIAALALLPTALRFGMSGLKWAERKSLLSFALCDKLKLFAAGVLEGINDAKQSGIYGKLFALSILLRLGKYLGLYALLLALVVPLGHNLKQFPFPTVFLAQLAAETGASLPVSGPMGVGGYQAGWILMFNLLGFPPDLAGKTSIAHHAASQLWGYGIGFIAIIVLLLPVFKIRAINKSAAAHIDSELIFTFKILATVALVAATCVGLYFIKL